MSPIVPHFASECLEDLGEKNEKSWPKINDKYLIRENINIVLQINGKKERLLLVKRMLKKRH